MDTVVGHYVMQICIAINVSNSNAFATTNDAGLESSKHLRDWIRNLLRTTLDLLMELSDMDAEDPTNTNTFLQNSTSSSLPSTTKFLINR